MTSEDDFIVGFVEKLKIPLFFFLIFDVVFYTSHNLVHQKMTIKQTRNSYFSIGLSMIMLFLFCFELLDLIMKNRHMEVKSKQETLEDLIVKKAMTEKKENPKKSLKEIIRKLKKKKSANEINNLFYVFEAELKKTSEAKFFLAELKEDLFHQKLVKFFNIICIVKVLIMEPIYITMQMNKMLQMGFLTLIQFVFFLYILYMAFVKRAFVSWWSYLFIVLHEIALTMYFIVGFIIYFKGERKWLGYSGWTKVQLMLVLFLMIAITCGVVKLILAQVILLMKRCSSNKSEEKVKAEVESVNCRKNS